MRLRCDNSQARDQGGYNSTGTFIVPHKWASRKRYREVFFMLYDSPIISIDSAKNSRDLQQLTDAERQLWPII